VTRIVVANEPVLSRETLARTIASLRPAARVTLISPEELENAIRLDAPDLIICSDASDLLTTHANYWLVLHPGGSPHSLVGERSAWQLVGELPLEAILALVDGAAPERARRTSAPRALSPGYRGDRAGAGDAARQPGMTRETLPPRPR
jgi:hypothetical protein